MQWSWHWRAARSWEPSWTERSWATRGGDSPDGRKVRGTMHWVSAAHAVPAEIRLYAHLFKVPHPARRY